jgi:hypothetical protein
MGRYIGTVGGGYCCDWGCDCAVVTNVVRNAVVSVKREMKHFLVEGWEGRSKDEM